MMTIVIRCDASPAIGFGHLMRCLALADRCRRQGDAVRVVIREDAGAARVLREAGVDAAWLPSACSVEQAAAGLRDELRPAADETGPVWSVVDTYEQPARYAQAAQQAGASVLMIDDGGQAHVTAQLLVNWNLDADASWYPSHASAQLLLGGSYACLRREFSNAAPRAASPSVRRVLVTLGGSDAGNRTALGLQALAQLPAAQRQGLRVDVVLGPGCAHREALEQLLPSLGFRCALQQNVAHMSDLMRQADVGIIAAGGTLYEAACLGLPSLVMVLADNQVPNADAFGRRGLAVVMGRADSLAASDIAAAAGRLIEDAEARARMQVEGPACVDGRGAERIRQAMLALSHAEARR